MSLQINDVAPDFDATDFEGVRPDLLDLVQGATACSSTVFYGLLAWANLQTHNPSNAHTHSKHTARTASTQVECYDQFRASC